MKIASYWVGLAVLFFSVSARSEDVFRDIGGISSISQRKAQEVLDAVVAHHATFHSYRCLLETTVILADRREERVYDYAFRQPDQIRMKILRGPNKGTVLFYRDGHVIAKPGGLFRFLKLNFEPGDRAVTTLRGGRVNQTDFWFIIGLMKERTPSCIFHAIGQQDFQGRKAEILELIETGHVASNGYRKVIFWIDLETRHILGYELYDAEETLAFRQIHFNIETDPFLPKSYFDP